MPTIYRRTLKSDLRTKPLWYLKLLAILNVVILPWLVAKELGSLYKEELHHSVLGVLKHCWTVITASKEDLV